MLLTKLHIPPAGDSLVHRPQLYKKLNIGLSRKLIVISAPAGFGKTTLLSEGKYKVVIDRCYTLEKIVEATKYVETGQKAGNVAITVAHNDQHSPMAS